MSDETENMDLQDLEEEATANTPAVIDEENNLAENVEHSSNNHAAADLEAVYDIPVAVSAILGKAKMDVSDLLKLGQGTVVELDRKVGEAIDIYVNNRLVARGEVVVVEERLGITMTEIIKGGAS